MAFIPKRYFYDKVILALLSGLLFVSLLCVTTIILRVISGQGTADYFIQYRSTAGIGGFDAGGVMQILAYIVFICMTTTFSFLLSVRSYDIKHELSRTILVLGVLLTVTAGIVSNALLALR